MAFLYTRSTGRTQESVQDVEGVLVVIICELVFTTSYCIIHFYPSRLPILRRETNEQIYKFSAFYLAEIICEFPIGFLRSFVGLAITYIGVGFNNGFWLYIQLSFTLLVTAFTSHAYGLWISGLFKSFCMEVSSVTDLIFLTLSGIYVSLDSYRYMRYISLFFFSSEALSIIFWHDVSYIGKQFFLCLMYV